MFCLVCNQTDPLLQAAENAGALSGLGSEASLRLLLAALITGAQHPLTAHSQQLAQQVKELTWATIHHVMEKLVHFRLAVREAAQKALTMVLSVEWWKHPLFTAPAAAEPLAQIARLSLQVETDPKRLEIVRALAPHITPSMEPRLEQRRIFRPRADPLTIPLPAVARPPVAATNWNALFLRPVLASASKGADVSSLAPPQSLPVVTFTPNSAYRQVDLRLATMPVDSKEEAPNKVASQQPPLTPEQLVRNASQCLLRKSTFSYLAERIVVRYTANGPPQQPFCNDAKMYALDLCSVARKKNYQGIYANCSILKEGALAELVLAEWMAALTHSDAAVTNACWGFESRSSFLLQVVADAVANASGLYICLATQEHRAALRKFMVRFPPHYFTENVHIGSAQVKTCGPRSAADLLRAYLVAHGFINF
jgi:hypothetical protein